MSKAKPQVKMESEKTEEKVLAKLREICLALPEVQEVKTWGHPTFQSGKKSFALSRPPSAAHPLPSGEGRRAAPGEGS